MKWLAFALAAAVLLAAFVRSFLLAYAGVLAAIDDMADNGGEW